MRNIAKFKKLRLNKALAAQFGPRVLALATASKPSWIYIIKVNI